MEKKARIGVVPAVFRSREQAEAAVHDIRRLGLTDKEIGVAIADPIFHRLTDAIAGDDDIVGEQELRGAAAGFILGAPIGSLAGIALMMLVVGGLGPLGLGGILVGAGAGAIWGMVIGSEAGLIAKVHSEEEQEHWSKIPLSREGILVVVQAGNRTVEVHDIMVRRGAQCFCFMDRLDRSAA